MVAEAVKLRTEKDPYLFSEDALAAQFVTQNPNYRWVQSWGCCFVWNGQSWERDETLRLFDDVRNFCGEINIFADGAHPRKELGSAKIVAAVTKLIKADRRIAATSDQWDNDPWLINTPGGELNLRTGSLDPNMPESYMTRITSVAPAGEYPLWISFLTDVTNGSNQLIEYLQRISGYALTGSTREHALFFLYGTGRNGKGVFTNTLNGILNDYAKVAPVETFTASRNERHPAELAMLRGARLVTAQETEEGGAWAESRIKALTAGDPVTARFMRQDFFTYTPQLKLFIAGNHKPSLKTVDEAMRSRLHLIPFTVTIPEDKRDPELANKLREEWPGILNWMLHGCLDYLDLGLQPPEEVLSATSEYFVTQDTFSEWLDDECEVGTSYWEPSALLFSRWKEYAKLQNAPIGRQAELGEKLKVAGFRYTRDNVRGRIWEGLRLKPQPQPDRFGINS